MKEREKKQTILFYTEKEVKKVLQKEAIDADISLTQYIEFIVKKHLKEKNITNDKVYEYEKTSF